MRPSNECPSRGPAADEGIIWAPPPSLFQPRSSRLAVPFQPRQRAHSGSFPPSGVSRWGAQIEKVNSGGEKKKRKRGSAVNSRVSSGRSQSQKNMATQTNLLVSSPTRPKKKSSNSSNHNSHLSNLRLTAQFYHQNAHRVLHRVSHHKGT